MRYVSPSTILISSLVYLTSHISILKPYIEVDITQGRLRGIRTISRNGRSYYEFLGIPYAKPPIGHLRFEPPELPENWTGIRLATIYGRNCLQYEFLTHLFTGSEDCLTLNIYTHQVLKLNEIETNMLKPVIVYIFGGLFMSGFSFLYRGKYLMDEDVVLVTFNYRVNSFGFLNTGDDVIRGNMGLKDQVMVLHWIQQNIKYFGGNPNLVTIMGQSAGGSSTHYHLLSNMSKGLFHRAISQSGTALLPWSVGINPRQQANRLGKALNCPIENSRILADCLKSRSSISIALFHKEYLNPIPNPITLYGPTIEFVNDEKAFLTDSPINLLKNGQVANKIPWIVGVTNGEGYLFASYLLRIPEIVLSLNQEWYKYGPGIGNYENHPNKYNISTQISSHYFQNKKINENNIENIAQLYGDYTMYLGFQEAIQLHSKIAPVYPYIFTYNGNPGITNILINMLGGRIPRFLDFIFANSRKWIFEKSCQNCIQKYYGVTHADELVYQFNIPVLIDEIIPGSKDYPFSNAFIKLWMSIVQYGKPNNFYGINWKPIPINNSNDDISFLKLDDSPELLLNVFKNISKFWNSLNLNIF